MCPSLEINRGPHIKEGIYGKNLRSAIERKQTQIDLRGSYLQSKYIHISTVHFIQPNPDNDPTSRPRCHVAVGYDIIVPRHCVCTGPKIWAMSQCDIKRRRGPCITDGFVICEGCIIDRPVGRLMTIYLPGANQKSEAPYRPLCLRHESGRRMLAAACFLPCALRLSPLMRYLWSSWSPAFSGRHARLRVLTVGADLTRCICAIPRLPRLGQTSGTGAPRILHG